MKCQILFSGKNKKNISKCRLLKILPRVLSVKAYVKLLSMTIFMRNFNTFFQREKYKSTIYLDF